jgi:hypothetical protein
MSQLLTKLVRRGKWQNTKKKKQRSRRGFISSSARAASQPHAYAFFFFFSPFHIWIGNLEAAVATVRKTPVGHSLLFTLHQSSCPFFQSQFWPNILFPSVISLVFYVSF